MSRRHGLKPARRRRSLLIGAIVAGLAVLVTIGVTVANAQETVPHSDADPFVASFAKELKGEVHPPLPAPERYSHGARLGNCDWSYGTKGECVPYAYPPGVADTPAAKCAYLKSQGAEAIEVRGKDTQRLVPQGGPKALSGNALACPAELKPR